MTNINFITLISAKSPKRETRRGRKRLLIVVSLLSIAGFYGCKKQEPFYPLHATINGAVFNATNCIVLPSTYGFAIYGGGGKGNIVTEPYIDIVVTYNNGPGVYTIEPTVSTHSPYATYENYCGLDSAAGVSYFSESGTITLTATSPNIQGSFNFVTLNNITVKGSFSVKAP